MMLNKKKFIVGVLLLAAVWFAKEVRADPIPSGEYTIQHKLSGKFITLRAGNQIGNVGATLCSQSNAPDQEYKITLQASGMYTIFSANPQFNRTARFLTKPLPFGKQESANVVASVNNEFAKFYLCNCNDGCVKLVLKNGLAIDSVSETIVDGAPLSFVKSSASETQKFRLIPGKQTSQTMLLEIQKETSEIDQQLRQKMYEKNESIKKLDEAKLELAMLKGAFSAADRTRDSLESETIAKSNEINQLNETIEALQSENDIARIRVSELFKKNVRVQQLVQLKLDVTVQEKQQEELTKQLNAEMIHLKTISKQVISTQGTLQRIERTIDCYQEIECQLQALNARLGREKVAASNSLKKLTRMCRSFQQQAVIAQRVDSELEQVFQTIEQLVNRFRSVGEIN